MIIRRPMVLLLVKGTDDCFCFFEKSNENSSQEVLDKHPTNIFNFVKEFISEVSV